MKKQKLLAGIIPAICLVGLLLFITVFGNKKSDIQQKYVTSGKEMTKPVQTSNLEVGKQVDLEQNDTKAKKAKKATSVGEVNRMSGKDTVTGFGAIASNKTAGFDTSIKNYDATDITTVTDVEDLQSAHPYANNYDHMWVYKKAGADVLKVTFSSSTYMESGYDYIYLYNANDELIGTYTSSELAGKMVIVWSDAIKIRLCSESSRTYYGFSVDKIEAPSNYAEYTFVEPTMPKSMYETDTSTQTLKCNKKYIEAGQVKTGDGTNDVHFAWKTVSGAEMMDVKIENAQLLISAKKAGKASGYIEVYVGTNETPVTQSLTYEFEVKTLVREESSYNERIYVNQVSQRTVGQVYVRDVLTSPVVTNVTSSDPGIICYVQDGAISTATYRLRGIKTGTATITVYYTVKDGTKDVSASRSFDLSCSDGYLWGSIGFGSISPRELIPTQTAVCTFSLCRSYYDITGESVPDFDADLSKYTIEAHTEKGQESLVTISRDGNKLLIYAKSSGSGTVEVSIKEDGIELYNTDIDFNIQTDRYLLAYDGPTELYTNQVVSAPILTHFVYQNGVIDKQPIDDAEVSCSATSTVTYKDKTLIAASGYSSNSVLFTCTYGGENYSKSISFCVDIPDIVRVESLYKDDQATLRLSPAPVIADDCTLTWTVQNAYTYYTGELASIEKNNDGTATVHCKGTGDIRVTATIKRGGVVLCTSNQNFTINTPVSGLANLNPKTIKVNQKTSIYGTDYKINNTYYDTSITGVRSSDDSVVEVLNYTKTAYQDYSTYYFNFKGSNVGKATITISYTYIDQDGTPVPKEETVEVNVVEDDYKCVFDVQKYTGIPGETLSLGAKIRRQGYDINGKEITTYITPSAVTYEKATYSPDIVTIENNRLTFKADAAPGSSVSVIASATANGKVYTSSSSSFRVVSTYYKLNGVDDDTIYIKAGETKTLTPALYQYDKDNLSGKTVENAEYLWEDSKNEGTYNANSTNEFFSATGMSIKGTKGGEADVTLVASYQDETNSKKYIKKTITVVVVPEEVPILEMSQRGAVPYPGAFFKITPKTTGTYKISCSNETNKNLVRVLDHNLKEVGSYTLDDSAYPGYLSVPVSLKAGETYYVHASATCFAYYQTFEYYTVIIEPGTVAKSIMDCEIICSAETYIYNGNEQKATVIVKDGTKTLVEGTDYILDYVGDRKNAGTYSITISGKGNYSGSIKKGILIKRFELTDDMLQPSKMQVITNGEVQKPDLVVKNGEVTLVPGTDYTIFYKGDFKAIGDYLITMTGIGNYQGAITKTFEIREKLDLTKCTVKLSKDNVTYNSEEQKPTVTVLNGTTPLTEGTDYIVDYGIGDYKKIATYTITVTGQGEYEGYVNKAFKIEPIDFTKCTVKLSKESVTYNGGVQKPEVTVLNGTTPLTEGTDYDITYPEGMTDVKSYTITLTGKGDYDGNVEKNFKITPYSVASLTVSLSATSRTYNKSTIKPTVTVKNGNKVLVVNTDYTVSYVGTFQNPGIYKVMVTGTGNYSGSKTLTYTINKASSTVAFTTKAISKKYGDKAFSLALTTTSKKPVTYTSSNGNVVKVDEYGKVTIVGAGKAIVTATYAGDTIYNGAKATCTITVAKIGNSITASNVVKTASSKAQSFSIKVLTKGKTTLGYTSSNKAVTVKAGKVTIAKDFVGKATITIKAASTTNYNAATKSITITVNPAGTKITSLKKQSKNKFLLKWSKNAKASGYEIQYATSKSFKSAVTKIITKNSTTSYTASSLKKKKTYYVRVRTYKTVGKVKFYSGWSTIKSVKN